MLTQLPQMTRTVVRVEPAAEKKGKGKKKEGEDEREEEDEGAFEPEPPPQEDAAAAAAAGEGQEGEGDDSFAAFFPPPPGEGEEEEPSFCLPSTQDALLEEERAIEAELAAAAASGKGCWEDGEEGGSGGKGRRFGVSEYRLLGLSKLPGVCDWLADRLQVGRWGRRRQRRRKTLLELDVCGYLCVNKEDSLSLSPLFPRTQPNQQPKHRTAGSTRA